MTKIQNTIKHEVPHKLPSYLHEHFGSRCNFSSKIRQFSLSYIGEDKEYQRVIKNINHRLRGYNMLGQTESGLIIATREDTGNIYLYVDIDTKYHEAYYDEFDEEKFEVVFTYWYGDKTCHLVKVANNLEEFKKSCSPK